MCYSAQVEGDYQRFVKAFGAILSIHEFVKLSVEKRGPGWGKLPKAIRDAFRVPRNEVGFEFGQDGGGGRPWA
jgi:hypothetical protein